MFPRTDLAGVVPDCVGESSSGALTRGDFRGVERGRVGVTNDVNLFPEGRTGDDRVTVGESDNELNAR